MLLRLGQPPVIDNLRNYPETLVERLRALLRDGALAQPDPRRRGFYDVADGERVFFIHLSPVTGNVWLLASWAEQSQTAQPARSISPIVARASAARFFSSCAHPG